MNIYIVLIVFSSIAVAVCCFLTTYLLVGQKKLYTKALVLVLLIVALALRIAKSVFYFLIPDLASLAVAIGFFGFSMLGPLSYYYFCMPTNVSKLTVANQSEYLHLLFPIAGSIAITATGKYFDGFYLLCSVSLAIYLWLVHRNSTQFEVQDEKLAIWNKVLYASLIVLLITFTFPYFIPFVHSYAIGTAIASAVVYILFIYFIKYSPKLYKNETRLEIDTQYEQRIIEALEQNELYKRPALTLAEFSDEVGIPQYIISKVAKRVYNKTFPEAVNSLRVAEIKEKLKGSKSIDAKVEQLAFDAGFNTLSTFYAVFKKETSMSPREYQRKLSA